MIEKTVISAHIKPNKKKFRIHKKDGNIIIEVTEKAEKGKANAELIKQLSRKLKCKVRILKGATSSKKIIELEGENIEGIL